MSENNRAAGGRSARRGADPDFQTRAAVGAAFPAVAAFLAALLLVALAALGAVYVNALSVERFESAIVSQVNCATLGTDEDSLRAFARDTIFYLSGEREGWNPQISILGLAPGGFIPQSFRDHMETVRGWAAPAKGLLAAGAALALALLLCALPWRARRERGRVGGGCAGGLRAGAGCTRGSYAGDGCARGFPTRDANAGGDSVGGLRAGDGGASGFPMRDANAGGDSARGLRAGDGCARGFPVRGAKAGGDSARGLRAGDGCARGCPAPGFPVRAYYFGAALPLAVLCALALWALIDFNGLWGFLHRTFIPDGIFNASEPVMLLFPESLFAAYLAPVGGCFALFLAVVLALPWPLAAIGARMGRAEAPPAPSVPPAPSTPSASSAPSAPSSPSSPSSLTQSKEKS